MLINDSIKMNPIYKKLLVIKNNFKKKIDTSVSVVKNNVKKRKKIKMKSTTPPKFNKYIVNPFFDGKNGYKNIEQSKLIYIRKNLLTGKKGLSVDKINTKKSKNIKSHLNEKYFGELKNLDIKLKKMRNRYVLTPIKNTKDITKIDLSADRIPNKYLKLKKNNVIKKKINNNIRIINKKENKTIISELSTHSSLFSRDNNKNIISKTIK